MCFMAHLRHPVLLSASAYSIDAAVHMGHANPVVGEVIEVS